MAKKVYKYEPKEGWASYIARQRKARVASGLCRYCKEPAISGKRSCQYHIDYQKAYRKAEQEIRREEMSGFRRCVRVFLTDEETKLVEEFGDPETVIKSLAFQHLNFLKQAKETVEP